MPNMTKRIQRRVLTLAIAGLLLLTIGNRAGAQTRIRDFIDAEIFLKGVFGQECRMDEYGILKINGKDYKAGNVTFRLGDVRIRIEETKPGPNCPPPCTAKVLVKFDCRKSACIYAIQSEKSIEFPASMASYQLEFDDVRKGRKMYSVFLELQRFLRQSNAPEGSTVK